MAIQYCSFKQEFVMYMHLRQYYRPKPDRVPGWLRRIWLWF